MRMSESTRKERLKQLQDSLAQMFAELELVDPSNLVGRKRETLLAKKIAHAENKERILIDLGRISQG